MNRDPEEAVRAHLDRLRLPYQVLPCDPALADTASFCAHYGVPAENSVNTIVVTSKKAPRRQAACLVQASSQLDVNRTVKGLMGDNVSFAGKEETLEWTGQLLGGVAPFALPDAWPVYVDAPIMNLEFVVVGGGSRAVKIRVTPEVFRQMPQVEVIAGLGRPRAPEGETD